MFENFSKTEIAKKTFLFDSCRCFCSGVLELLFNNFALVMAIRVFDAPKSNKKILVAAWFIGNFIAPMTQIFATKTKRFTTMDFSKVYMLSVAAIILASVFVDSFYAFFALIIAATVLFKQPAPLMADVYGQNYSPQERGGRLSIVLMILPLPGVLFARKCGQLIDADLQNYKLILVLAAMAAIGSGLSFSKIPARVLPPVKAESIFSNFKIIAHDKLFAMMLFWWSFAGIATQMTKPLRAEYLINPSCGIGMSTAVEAMACTSIPLAFRLLTSLVWGKFFDKSRVIILKIAINVFLAFGIWLFFFTKIKGVIYLSSALIGIAYGGGEIALSLWITRIAPREKFSAYAGVNIAVAGLVGLTAPFIGYELPEFLTFRQIGLCAVVLLIISSVGFLSLLRHPRFANESKP
jgi:hypothetical protein